MRFTYKKFPNRHHGFSLIELMISVVIGLLGIVVIFQVLTVWDSRKRTTTSGSDAQVAGTIGMFALDRDMKQVGYGFGMTKPGELGCNVVATNALGVSANFPLLPVSITQGATGAPDQLTIMYGNSSYFGGAQTFTSSTATTKRTKYRTGFFKGDLVLVTDNPATAATGNCALVEVTNDENADPREFSHENISYVKFGATAASPSRFNPATGTGTTFLVGNLYNLGPGPRRSVWQIRQGGVLAVGDTISASGVTDVAEGIVDLQAEYGSGVPLTWSDTPPTNWADLQAVRVAILSRSQQFEKEAVTAAAVPFFGGSRTFAMGNVFGADSSNGVGSPTNWRNYRYPRLRKNNSTSQHDLG